MADTGHPLAKFSVDPVGSIAEGEDAWEKINGPLNTLLQHSPESLQELVQVGEMGLIGLHRYLEYFVVHHGIEGALIEMKLNHLIDAMDNM